MKRHWENFKTGRNLFEPSRQTAHQKQKSAYVFRCSVPTGLSLLSHYIEPKSNLFHLVLTKIIAKRSSPTQQLVASSNYKRYTTHLLKNKTAEIPGPPIKWDPYFLIIQLVFMLRAALPDYFVVSLEVNILSKKSFNLLGERMFAFNSKRKMKGMSLSRE